MSDLMKALSNLGGLRVLLVLGFLAPGLLTTYLFKPELFQVLDVVKVILFSVSLTFPFVIGMYLATFMLKPSGNSDNEVSHVFLSLVFATFLVNVIFYLGLGLAYVTGISFRTFFVRVLIAHLFIALWILLEARSQEASKKVDGN